MTNATVRAIRMTPEDQAIRETGHGRVIPRGASWRPGRGSDGPAVNQECMPFDAG